jgi:hypothetical protein
MSKRSPVVVFLGWLVMAVGVLVALTAGLCTLLLAPSMFSGPGDVSAGLVLLSVFGGVPALVGVGMVLAGWSIVRPPRPSPPETK